MCEFSLVIVICKQLRIGAYEPDCLFYSQWLVFRYCGRLYCRRCVQNALSISFLVCRWTRSSSRPCHCCWNWISGTPASRGGSTHSSRSSPVTARRCASTSTPSVSQCSWTTSGAIYCRWAELALRHRLYILHLFHHYYNNMQLQVHFWLFVPVVF